MSEEKRKKWKPAWTFPRNNNSEYVRFAKCFTSEMVSVMKLNEMVSIMCYKKLTEMISIMCYKNLNLKEWKNRKPQTKPYLIILFLKLFKPI